MPDRYQQNNAQNPQGRDYGANNNQGQPRRQRFNNDALYRNTNLGTRNTLRPKEEREQEAVFDMPAGRADARRAARRQQEPASFEDYSRNANNAQRYRQIRAERENAQAAPMAASSQARTQQSQMPQGAAPGRQPQGGPQQVGYPQGARPSGQPQGTPQAGYPRGEQQAGYPQGVQQQQSFAPGSANFGEVKRHPVHPNRSSYQGYSQYARSQGRGAYPNPNGETAYYGDRSRYTAKKSRKPVNKIAVVVSLLIVAAIGVGAWFFLNPSSFAITVNGTERTVDRGTTIGDLIDMGYAAPMPGNLLALDGSLLETGGGNAFTGNINGNEANDPATEVHKEDVVVIDNGTDATEDFTVEEVQIEPETLTPETYGAIHAYVQGVPGKVNRKTGKISGITVDETVQEVVNHQFVKYNADTGDDKVIALTFDDGPWPDSTQQILDILNQYGAKATFFTIGKQFDDYGEPLKNAVSQGHQILTHTWDHASGSGNGVDLTRMSTDEQIQEVQKGFDVIREYLGVEPSPVFRSPGGNFSGDIVWTLEPYVNAEIGWNIDTEDWQRPGVDAIVSAIESAKPGNIVLMHDGGGDRSQTVEALRIALPALIDKGYRFVTIDELLAYNDPASMVPSKDSGE